MSAVVTKTGDDSKTEWEGSSEHKVKDEGTGEGWRWMKEEGRWRKVNGEHSETEEKFFCTGQDSGIHVSYVLNLNVFFVGEQVWSLLCRIRH